MNPNLRKSTLALIIAFCFVLAQSHAQNKGKRPQGPKMAKFITGTVIDKTTNNPLDYATITLYSKRDSSVIGGGLSEEGGHFKLQVKGRKVYALVEYISYQATKIDPIEFEKGQAILNLGTIAMESEGIALDNVEITAERSETTFALDKKVFTVGKDLANRGGSAEDILNNVPSVSVDIEGNVSLRGSEGVRILIDGKPSGLVGVGNTNGLRNIPSNLIEKVEVVTNPSARYEAEGMAGILNIVLKKNKGYGFNGSIDVSGGLPERAGISANLNYRKEKLNWFLNYGLNLRSGPGGGYSIQDRNIEDNATGLINREITTIDRNMNRGGLTNSFRFGADYHFNEKENITASFLYRVSDDKNESDLLFKDYSEKYSALGHEPQWLRTDLDFTTLDDFEKNLLAASQYSSSIRTDDELELETNLEYSLNYEKQFSSRKHKLTATIQFREKGETEDNVFKEVITNFFETDVLELDQKATNAETSQTLLAQVDYVHPLGKDHKWEVGVRSSLRNIDTDFLVEEKIDNLWSPIPGLNNAFVYDENIHAIYGIYGNRINDFSFQAGIRGEYSEINTELLASTEGARNVNSYLNLFPSGHLSYHFSEVTATQISYSRRIQRPSFWDLNPFYTFQDNRNYFSGNPALQPQFTDSYEIGQLNYWDNLTLSGSLFYRKTRDSKQRILAVDKVDVATIRIPVNVGTITDYGLDISSNYTLAKWLKLDFNTNIFRNRLAINDEEAFEAVYKFYQQVRSYSDSESAFRSRFTYDLNATDNYAWNGRLTAKLSFWDSDFQIRGNHGSASESSQGRRQGRSSIDLGWSKDFLSNRNLTLTLSINDVFNSRVRHSIVVFEEFFQESEFRWRNRSANLTVSYRINQKKKKQGNRRGQGSRDIEG